MPAPLPSQRLLVEILRLRDRFAPYASSTGVDQETSPTAQGNDPATTKLDAYGSTGCDRQIFFFGPSLLVQPMTAGEPGELPICLPAGAAWFDFWTGASYPGEQSIRTPAPLDILPMFARAGSLLPLALPSHDETADALELRVYPGANGNLLLSDPPCSSSDPGRGDATASIPLEWNDHTRTLRIGARLGDGLARPAPLRLYIVIVRPGHGIGHLPPPRPDQWIDYDGSARVLTFATPPPPPRAPVGLVAKIRADRIHFTWHQSCEGVIYRLKRTPGLNSPCEDLASGLHVPAHSIPIPVCGSRFRYFVTAMNAGGESPPSTPVVLVHQTESTPNDPDGRLPLAPASRATPEFPRLAQGGAGLVALNPVRTFQVDPPAGRNAPAGPIPAPHLRARPPLPARSTVGATRKARMTADPSGS